MSYLIAVAILILSVPIGYLLKLSTKEEMKSGKKYFKILFIVSWILAFVFLLIPIGDAVFKNTVIFSLLFIGNVAFISWK